MSNSDRLAALVATVEWLGTYAGYELTLAEGATEADGVPADMVAAYALAQAELARYQALSAKVNVTMAFRAAVRAEFIARGVKPVTKTVNRLAAAAMAKTEIDEKAG
jgi:hypothetical protein